MKRGWYHKSKKVIAAKRYPKSDKIGLPCYKKTIYPSMEEAEKGATMVWSKDPSAQRDDLHGYKCPDGCNGYHIGHKSYYEMTCQTSAFQPLN